jgi:hypothetical protein
LVKRTRAIAVLAVAGSMVFAADAAMEISPRSPRECDVITLKVQRSFTQDCLWQVTPKVRRDDERIEITLDLRGSAACDQVLTDRTFEIPIGTLPAGNYVLSVRWSDQDAVESQPLTVFPTRAERE